MQAEPGVVAALALLDREVVTDLPTDAVAAVVAGDHLADGDVGAVLHEDAPGVVAVQFLVVRLVPVEGEILDGHVGDELAAQEREKGRSGRRAPGPEVLAQPLVEPEAVPGPGDE